MKEPINIFWFKKDLRLLDNDPLNNALSQKEKLLLIYCFEPSLKKNKHYSNRHWNFVKESINDLNIYLKKIDTGCGWVPADQSLTPFGEIGPNNPFGSTGDLRLVPDKSAEYKICKNELEHPFHFFISDIKNLNEEQ